jgi:hypothetical protein
MNYKLIETETCYEMEIDVGRTKVMRISRGCWIQTIEECGIFQLFW